MRILPRQTKAENGFVSILTVVMFMILTTIVTVSFVTLTLGEQRQTLNDDLAKGAYEAAQAGVEDAKRAIRYCNNTATCSAAELYYQDCPGFFASASMRSGLGLNYVNSTIQVGEASVNQRYTCTTISNQLIKFWGELDPDSASAQTVFLPLKSAGGFNRVKISWSMKSGTATIPSFDPSNPPKSGWGAGWPAMMRAMIIEHPTGNITASNESQATNVTSKSSFLVPSSSNPAASVAYSSMASRMPARCSTGNMGGAGNVDGEYLCSITIDGFGGSGRDYYLQLAPYYKAAAFKIELFNGGNPAPMQDAGYMVDSTGAVADVYRRIQVLLGPDDVVSPGAAIQSGEKLCKNFSVTGSYLGNVLFGEECNPLGVTTPPPTPNPGGGGGGGGIDVGVGGWCSVNVCIPGEVNPNPTNYDQLLVNQSNNPSSEVASCTWVISDGTRVENQHCNMGDSFYHTFPTTPYPPKANYTITLTIRLKSGAQASYVHHVSVPN